MQEAYFMQTSLNGPSVKLGNEMTKCDQRPKSQYENWCYAHDRSPSDCYRAEIEELQGKLKVSEQQVDEWRERFREARHRAADLGNARAQLELVAWMDSFFHGTHDLRNLDGVRPTCPAVNEDMACQEDLGHPLPHRYCAGKGQPVYEWPVA